MTAAWVAGAVRARAIVGRCIGPTYSRRLAESESLAAALRLLEDTPYGRDVHRGQTLAEAQHAIAAVTLWHLRVLAGWVPPDGVHLLRALAAWFEIANADGLLLGMRGGSPAAEFELGTLATAWPRLRSAGSPAALRAALAASVWGDPGGDSPREIRLGMRARWATLVAAAGGPARTWACGAAALMMAGDRFVARRQLPPAALARLRRLLDEGALGAESVAALASALPAQLRWAFADASSAEDLWRAEAAWWARVEWDSGVLLGTSVIGSESVLGASVLLACDAWRARAALEIAARGGGPLEAYDAVA